jgi:hypothetical protein
MAKLTVLEMVQDILSDMDSDEVNSIDDTTEAMQVARIIRTTYNEIIDGVDEWPHLNTLVALDASGDVTKPTHMKLPESLQGLGWIKYNKKKSGDTREKYADVGFMDSKEFVDYTNQRVSSDTDVTAVTDFSGVVFYIKNDVAPTYWTTFDDEWIVFDAYDSAVDSTLQSSKVQAEGPRDTTLTLTDTAIPDLPAKAFSYLLSESKSVAFNTLKQSANPKEEQRSRRQRYRLAAGGKSRTGDKVEFKGYGRK